MRPTEKLLAQIDNDLGSRAEVQATGLTMRLWQDACEAVRKQIPYASGADVERVARLALKATAGDRTDLVRYLADLQTIEIARRLQETQP